MASPTPTESTESLYPTLESFVERASAADVEQLFGPLKQELAGLKGPRAEQAKKVEKAIACTEELLAHLIDIRTRLEGERK